MGKLPKYTQHLRTWGEVWIVKKIKDDNVCGRGVIMIFGGYANGHTCDVYHMLNPGTLNVCETCGVIWIHMMFFHMIRVNHVHRRESRWGY